MYQELQFSMKNRLHNDNSTHVSWRPVLAYTFIIQLITEPAAAPVTVQIYMQVVSGSNLIWVLSIMSFFLDIFRIQKSLYSHQVQISHDPLFPKYSTSMIIFLSHYALRCTTYAPEVVLINGLGINPDSITLYRVSKSAPYLTHKFCFVSGKSKAQIVTAFSPAAYSLRETVDTVRLL